MITTFYPPFHFGGDGLYVRRLTHALAKRGHHVTVIHDVDAYRMLNHGSQPEPLQEPDGVVVHGLTSRLGALSSILTHQTGHPVVHGPRIAKILSEGFDVIHYHNISLVGGPGILAYGDALKLYTTHEHWLVCPSHTLWRHNRELCDSRECLRCVAAYRRPPQPWRLGSFLKKSCENVDAFITLSQSSANLHREFGFEFPMRVMSSFLPDAVASASSPATPPAQPYFLYVGRLEIIKGLQDVIPLFGDDSPAELWIAGTGNYENELRQLAAGKKAIRFLGHQSSADLTNLYRQAIAVVLPSVCYEVFPLVLLEAFREGTPVIARNLGPLPEIVNQSGGGLLFDTVADLKQALIRISSDSTLRNKLSLAGSAALEEKWSESAGIERYFATIEQVARERGRDELLDKLQVAKTASNGVP
jgi:glycosyltransferase involved in cell wall biosynthesis